MSAMRRGAFRLLPLAAIIAGLLSVLHGYGYRRVAVHVVRKEKADEDQEAAPKKLPADQQAPEAKQPAQEEPPPDFPFGPEPSPFGQEPSPFGPEHGPPDPFGERAQSAPPPPTPAQTPSPPAEQTEVVTEWELVGAATEGSLERSDGRLVRTIFVGRPAQKCPT